MNLRNLSMLACNEHVTLWYYWTHAEKDTVKRYDYLEEARGVIHAGDFILVSGCNGAKHFVVNMDQFTPDTFELAEVN